MLSIGEFSYSVLLSIKTIRYYQEIGILIPSKIDRETGYRYFDEKNFERAQSIQLLKGLGFTLNEIKNILRDCSDEDDLQQFINRKLKDVEIKIASLKKMKQQLQQQKKMSMSPNEINEGIIEFDFELNLYVRHKIHGKYDLIGRSFSNLYKNYGRFAIGKPYAFYNNMGYEGNNTNFEAVIEVDSEASGSVDETHVFSKSRAVKLIHTGPYGSQGSAYIQLFSYCRDHGYNIKLPVIEHFIKGPGLIFKGDPLQYQTECIVLIGHS